MRTTSTKHRDLWEQQAQTKLENTFINKSAIQKVVIKLLQNRTYENYGRKQKLNYQETKKQQQNW